MCFIVWVIANAAGLGFGVLLIILIFSIGDKTAKDFLSGQPYCCWDLVCCGAISSGNWSFKIIPICNLFLFTGVLTAILGFTLSFFQWLILRKKGVSAMSWLFWSTASYLAPCFLMLIYQYRLLWKHGFIQWGANIGAIDYGIFYGVVFGYFIISGLFQWVAIRKCIRYSWVWIIAMSISYFFSRGLIQELEAVNMVQNVIPPGWLFSKADFILIIWKVLFRIENVYLLPYWFFFALIFSFSVFTGLVVALLPQKIGSSKDRIIVSSRHRLRLAVKVIIIAGCLIICLWILLSFYTINNKGLDRSVMKIGSTNWLTQIAFIISPDNKRLAYIADSGKNRQVVIEGRKEKKYDDIGDLIFSPDSSHVAYAAKKGYCWVAVIDGKEGSAYDEIYHTKEYRTWIDIAPYNHYLPGINPYSHVQTKHALRFSPDSRHIAYSARRGNDWFLVVDSNEIIRKDELGEIVFRNDSKRLIYAFKKHDKWMLEDTGKDQKQYDGVENIILSNDGLHVAYKAKIIDKWTVVHDEVEGKLYSDIVDLQFSPDGNHIGYIATQNSLDQKMAVFDGREGRQYDGIKDLSFSPDSSRIAYWAYAHASSTSWKGLIIDDYEQTQEYETGHENVYEFSPDGSRFAYYHQGIVIRDKSGAMVDEIKPPNTQYIDEIIFYPDNKRIAYVGVNEAKYIGIPNSEFILNNWAWGIQWKIGGTQQSIGFHDYIFNLSFNSAKQLCFITLDDNIFYRHCYY